MNATNTTIIERLTCSCGKPFEWEHNHSDRKWADLLRPTDCPECCQKLEEDNHRQRQLHEQEVATEALQTALETTKAKLCDMTPPRYQLTDVKHPAFNRELWRQVKDWKPSDELPFLGLVGESGACKTRIGFALFKRLVIGQVKPREGDSHPVRIMVPTFMALTSTGLARLVGAQFATTGHRDLWDNDARGDARANLDRIRVADFVLLDDLGKAKNTPAVAAELFAIIDHRHAHNLPTIWTANSTPEEIVQGMSADMAGPLAGRLIECSNLITV